MLEASKGIIVLAAGFGALELLSHGAQHFVDQLVRSFHLNPASRYPQIFQHLADEATSRRLWGLAVGAAAYAIVRFIEAYGLWRQRRWAEWFSVVSGLIYIPIELWELTHGFTWPRITLLTVNLLIVGYLIWVMRARNSPIESHR